jgi:hypothetical protein
MHAVVVIKKLLPTKSIDLGDGPPTSERIGLVAACAPPHRLATRQTAAISVPVLRIERCINK